MIYGAYGDTAVHKLYPSISYTVPTSMSGPEFIEKLAGLPLFHQPGTHWDYGFSTDVLGLVIENVTRQTLGDYLERNLFRPLGMSYACFRVSPEMASRYAKPLPVDPDTGKPQSILDLTSPLKFDCGGACAASTAGDYLRFAEMLLEGGRLGNNRLLSRKTVEYMTADQLGPEIAGGDSPLGTDPGDAGLGFGLGVAVRRHAGIALWPGSPGDYYWLGAYGTEFRVDPKERLVVVFMMAARGTAVRRYRELVRALVLQAITD
jgi:CubicO group peptidase (beta-lactamase class C family)